MRETGSGRYRSAWNKSRLLVTVAAVARHAEPNDPAGISQRAFDDAREAAGYATAPTAKQIAARLRMRWEEVLDVALTSANPNGRLGRHQGEREAAWLSADYIRAALRLVAERLGGDSLTPDAYAAERDSMIAADQRRYRHGHQLALPTTVLGSHQTVDTDVKVNRLSIALDQARLQTVALVEKREIKKLDSSTQAALDAVRKARAQGTSRIRALFKTKNPKARGSFLRTHL